MSHLVLSPEFIETEFETGDYNPPCKISRLPPTTADLADYGKDFILAEDVLSSFGCIQAKNKFSINSCNLDTYSDNGKNCDSRHLAPQCLQPSIGFYWVKGSDGTTKKVCEYDLDLFDNIEMGMEYETKFGLKNPGADKIFKQLCFLSTYKDCPLDPETGKPFRKCAYIRAQNIYGDKCREWAVNIKPIELNFLKQRWCTHNKDSGDCKCLNRSENDDFKRLKNLFNNEDDYCWYQPCSNSGAYLTLDLKHDCKTVSCHIDYNFVENRDINLNDINNEINCTITPLEPSNPEPEPEPEPSIPKFNTPEPSTPKVSSNINKHKNDNFFDTNKFYIIGGIIIFLIIIIKFL
nr:MAG: putative myristylated membrane protein [Diabrotica toursvirus 3a]